MAKILNIRGNKIDLSKPIWVKGYCYKKAAGYIFPKATKNLLVHGDDDNEDAFFLEDGDFDKISKRLIKEGI